MGRGRRAVPRGPGLNAFEQQAAREAHRVLTKVPSYVWDGESLPIPVEKIADSVFGLRIREVEDLSAAPGVPPVAPGQNLSGLLLPEDGEIWVSRPEARKWPTRKRFTIGHELGHCVMHTDGGGTIFCRAPAVEPSDQGGPARPPLPPEEHAANIFAAELLMPEHAVRVIYRQKDGRFWDIAKCFGVSQAALERRLTRLGLEVVTVY